MAEQAVEDARQLDQPIQIPQDLALLLAASVKKYGGDRMVTNGGGTDASIIERAMRDVREKIDGLPEQFTFHDLRHYLASLLIAGHKTVQARMRHASAHTTLIPTGICGPMPTSPPARRSAL